MCIRDRPKIAQYEIPTRRKIQISGKFAQRLSNMFYIINKKTINFTAEKIRCKFKSGDHDLIRHHINSFQKQV